MIGLGWKGRGYAYLPTKGIWGENGTLRQRQEWLFEATFQEYCSFVLENHCFPTESKDGQTSRNTSLKSWRAAVKSKSPPKHRQRLVEFETDQLKRIAERKKYLYAVGFDWEDGCPDTFEEYMSGINRYIYFSPYTYMKIAKTFGFETTICPYIDFFLCLLGYKNSLHWEKVHREINLNCLTNVQSLKETLDKLFTRLDSRSREVIVHRFGLFGVKPLTNAKMGEMLSVSSSRSQQIEQKALRHLSAHFRSSRTFGGIKNIMADGGANNSPASGEHFFIVRQDNDVIHIARGHVVNLEEVVARAGHGEKDIESVKTYYSNRSYYLSCVLRNIRCNHETPVDCTFVDLRSCEK